MTPAGVGRIRPGDPGPALPGGFTETIYRDLLANHAQGAAGKPTKKPKQTQRSSPDFSRARFLKK